MASPQARTGTLEEGQVRAMFDRIARVYDLMNSLMTAGLHHRWRERAADLAALELPYPDHGFDAATVGFGARNFSDLDRGLAEMTRVVRPGGRVVILEITTPQRPPLSTFFALWFDRVVPALGKLAGDPDAYAYLPSSVKRFPAPEGLAARMVGVGLTDVRWILTAGGIIALHVGTVP